MYLLYNVRKDCLGIWMPKWDVVAVRFPIPARAVGGAVTWVEVEAVMDYNNLDWTIIDELEF